MGLKLKTFSFALALMTMVMLATLGALYLFLPDYYYWYKNRELQAGIEALHLHIENADSTEPAIAQAIFDFSDAHNSVVIAVDSRGYILPWFSTPFRFVQEPGMSGINIRRGVRIALDTGRTEQIVRDVAHPIIASLLITSTLQPIDEAQAVILSMAPYLIAVSLVISMAAAFLFSRQLTPITKLKEEIARTARLEESKTDFMRAAGHELKTPIAALNGMLEGMLDEVGVYKNHKHYLGECKQQVQRLAVLVQEILLASRSDDIDDSAEEVDIIALAQESVKNYETLIAQKNLRIQNVGDAIGISPTPAIICNKRKLYEVLSNLVSNAVKYSPENGLITLGMDNGQFFIENQVGDESPVNTPTERWFEPFFTPDYSRSLSGTGLGLYIVKKNLDAMGLEFELHATENEKIRFGIKIF